MLTEPGSIFDVIVRDPVYLTIDQIARNIFHFFCGHACINTSRFHNSALKQYTAPAATMELLCTMQRSITIAPMPINTSSSIVHPCTKALWPMETLLPIVGRIFLVRAMDHRAILHIYFVAQF
jgi:hypothetical protein